MFKFKQYDWKKYNFSLVIIVITLCITSAFLLKREAATPLEGAALFKKQIIGMMLGLFVMAIVSIIDYHFICKFAILYYIVGTLMVAATRYSPFGTNSSTEAYRWLDFGVLIQPSEICKICLIISLAVFFTKLKHKTNKFYFVILAALVTLLPTFFIFKQPDLSSSMVMIFIFCIMLYASGLSYKIIVPIVVIALPSIVAIFWYIQQPYQKLLTNVYQYNRIFGFLNPDLPETQKIVWQQKGAIQAIGSGELYGKMLLNNSAVRNHKAVPVTESDFIFTVIGEELGFIGSCVIIGLLALIIIKCIMIAKKSMDYTGQLIAIGISAMLMFQVFANIGVNIMILPNTGLPLPFLSSGISSMISCMISIGFIINIGLQVGNSSHNGFSLTDL